MPLSSPSADPQFTELLDRIGPGIVFFGSSRLRPGLKTTERILQNATELGRELAYLLESPVWTGGGPGMMQAVSQGAEEAGVVTAGVYIRQPGSDSGEVRDHPYLAMNHYSVAGSPAKQKGMLVNAGIRLKESDHTAFIVLPGGLGTMYELFEVIVLAQRLEQQSPHLQVPVILMNYDSFFGGLLEFFSNCVEMDTVDSRGGKLDGVVVACESNYQAHSNMLSALECVADFYRIDQVRRLYRSRVRHADLGGRFELVPTNVLGT